MKSEYTLDKDQLSSEAAQWVSKLHNGRLSRKEKQAFSRWLNQSHVHEQLFDEMNATWVSMGNAQYLPEVKEQIDRVKPYYIKDYFDKGLIQIAQYACALLVVAAALSQFSMENTDTSAQDNSAQLVQQVDTYSTQVGESKKIVLEDGSYIRLNTQSKVEVSYSAKSRKISLLQGEAYFSVAPDKKRPFIVSVGNSTVTAVGTEFNIYKKNASTAVTVTEGIVDVRLKNTDTIEQVTENLQVNVYRDTIDSPTTAMLNDVQWLKQQLVVSSKTLSFVIGELNRYLVEPVILSDSDVKRLKLSGTFDLANPQKTLQDIIDTYELSEYRSQGYRVLTREGTQNRYNS